MLSSYRNSIRHFGQMRYDGGMKGIDRYGALARPPVTASRSYLDLSGLDHPLIPTAAITGYHEYRGASGHLVRGAFSCSTMTFKYVADVLDCLSAPGVHIVALCSIMDDGIDRFYTLLQHWYPTHLPEAMHPFTFPRPFREWLPKAIDQMYYPHVCPTCGAPAYIGLNVIDCSAECPRVGGL